MSKRRLDSCLSGPWQERSGWPEPDEFSFRRTHPGAPPKPLPRPGEPARSAPPPGETTSAKLLCPDAPIRLARGNPVSRSMRRGKKSYPRRAIKRGGAAASARAAARRVGACRLEQQERWEEAPPGSAGVPPACYPVACRSVSPRCGTRPPCRRARHGAGRSRVLAPLPIGPDEADGPSCAKTCAGGTPALPGGLQPVTSSQQRRPIGIGAYSSFVVNNNRWFLPPMICPAGQRLSETTEKRVIHEDTRRTTKTHEARRRGEPEPFRAPDRPSRSPVSLSNDPSRRGGRGPGLSEMRVKSSCRSAQTGQCSGGDRSIQRPSELDSSQA